MEKKIIIAIDGFSSCGKSTLAKAMAKALEYVFVDTGAMYRAIALYFLRNNIAFNDTACVVLFEPTVALYKFPNDKFVLGIFYVLFSVINI